MEAVSKVSTQGCTELTCTYHGSANRLKLDGHLREDWEPGTGQALVEFDDAALTANCGHTEVYNGVCLTCSAILDQKMRG